MEQASSIIQWTEKPWGRAACLYQDGLREYWLAHVLAGGYSSRHFHRTKLNRFACLTATVLVTQYTGDDVQRIVLRPGMHLDVPAGIVHEFCTLVSGSMLEAYAGSPCDPADIVRLSANGRKYPD